MSTTIVPMAREIFIWNLMPNRSTQGNQDTMVITALHDAGNQLYLIGEFSTDEEVDVALDHWKKKYLILGTPIDPNAKIGDIKHVSTGEIKNCIPDVSLLHIRGVHRIRDSEGLLRNWVWLPDEKLWLTDHLLSTNGLDPRMVQYPSVLSPEQATVLSCTYCCRMPEISEMKALLHRQD